MSINSTRTTLDPKQKKLIAIYGLYSYATGLTSIFVNIFLWRLTNNISFIIKYNLFFVLFIPLMFIIGGKISFKFGLRINLFLGMFSYCIFHVLLLILRDNAVAYIPLLGIFKGIGIGFYYVAYNGYSYSYSNNENRENYYGSQSIIGSFVSLTAPLISGYLITSFMGINGYLIIFSLSFLLFAIGAYLSFTLPNLINKSRYRLKPVLIMAFKRPNWSRIMVSETLTGTREIVLSFIMGVLIYIATTNESRIGYYTVATSIIAIISGFISRKFINKDNRLKILIVSSIAVAIISSIFLIRINIITLWTFGILDSFFYLMMNICLTGVTYKVVDSLASGKAKRIEPIIVSEIFLNIGRFLSLIVFYFISSNNSLLPWFLSFLGILQVFIGIFLSQVNFSRSRRHPVLAANEA